MNKFLQEVNIQLTRHLKDGAYGVKELCKDMNLRQPQLYRKIKKVSGLSTVAMELLNTSDKSVKEVAYKVGFNDPAYFTRCFKNEYECSPTKIRKNTQRTIDTNG